MKSARRFFAVMWLALTLAMPFNALAQSKSYAQQNPYEEPYEEPPIESEPTYSYQTVAWAGGGYFAPSALLPRQTLDIAILGDGFTAAEQPQYRALVQNLIQAMIAQDPFKEYQRFINFHRVDVISNQSGTDYGDAACTTLDPYSAHCFKDTALDSGFTFPDKRSMRVDTNKVATALANSLGPPNNSMYDAAVVLVNSTKYGGSAGAFAGIVSIFNGHADGALHELGHTFAHLGDEYGSPGPPAPAPPPCVYVNEFQEPNLTAQPVLFQPQNDPGQDYKWNYWIPPGTPIPTLGVQNPVGVWEGAAYCNQGAWRPHYESKMRSITYPFGVVNTEVLAKRIYTFAPIVAATNPVVGATVAVPRGQPQSFSIFPLASPISHGFKIRWSVGGVVAAEGMFFTLNTERLSVGRHTVTAVIFDQTGFVRRDPTNLLNEELSWTVDVTAATPVSNPLEDNTFFVKQQYRDFLGREAEQSGLDAWVRVLTQCPPGDTTCDRTQVSASFFRSSEFMQNGYLVYRFYKVAYGRQPTFSEFVEDMQPVVPLDGQVEARRAFYADGFASRSSFAAIHDGRSNWDYVNGLMANAGGLIPSRDQLVADLNNGWKTRAQVLRAVVESQEVYDREYNRAFVAMEYFGYLRRDPEPDGYNAWLNYLNTHPGDYRTMVWGFVYSQEYRRRFGLT